MGSVIKGVFDERYSRNRLTVYPFYSTSCSLEARSPSVVKAEKEENGGDVGVKRREMRPYPFRAK